MIRTIVINQEKLQLDQQQVLGTGGEATVVKVKNRAVKLYHSIDAFRTEKITEFVKSKPSLPNNVCAPQDLVFDSKGTKVVGFAMNLIGAGHEPVQMLSSRKFRTANPHITLKFVTDLFINDLLTTQALHKNGIIIGDNNDLNELFHVTTPRCIFIDVDSFAIGKFPCVVGTEMFLPPELYNLDLTQKAYYTKEHDWYSFMAKFIRSAILVHPYGGTHNAHANLLQRALHKVTFFDKAVIYPKMGWSVELLNDDLKSVIDRMFGKGERFKPDVEMLKQYGDELVECRSCHMMHPASRSNCPQCATVNSQQVRRRVMIQQSTNKKVHGEEYLSTTGSFVWFKIFGNKICAISRTGNDYQLHIRDGTVKTTKIGTFKDAPTFGMFAGRYIVVGRNSALTIHDADDNMKELDSRMCGEFGGKIMFGCTSDYLLRVQNGFLYRGEMHSVLNKYVETKVCAVMENQTWFAASPLNNTIFVAQRLFSNLSFVIIKLNKTGHSQYNVDIPVLDPKESIIDTSVRFAPTGHVLLLLKTELNGKTHSRVFVIEENGTIISSYRVASLGSDVYRNIHGKAFVKIPSAPGMILHPTDNGVVQEVIGNNREGQQTLMAATEPFVSEGDSVILFGKGILVLSEKTVEYVTMN